MKSGWQIQTIGEVCEVFSDGDWIESKDQSSEGIRLIQTGNVGEGVFKDRAEKARYISEETFKRLRCTEIFEGDCLISRLPDPVGRSVILPYTGERMITAVDCTIVRFDHNQYLPRFFNYYSQSANYITSVAQKCTGTTRNRISRSNLSLIQIPVPSLTEQQRIVAILDGAFDGIATAKANAEKNIQNARALFESHLQSVFAKRGTGWVIKRIKDIAKHSLGKMLDKAKNKGIPQLYLRNLNVRWFTFDLSDLLQMPFLSEEQEKYTAIKGDVLICEGGYPGRAAIWDEDYPIYFQKALHRVRFHEPEQNKWFLYYLYAQDKSGELKQHFNGAGIQHFTGEALARFELPLAPLEEMRTAIALFESLSTEIQCLESIFQRKLESLDELKQSILHQAVHWQ
jgi:type I restriction enzyme S subunit